MKNPIISYEESLKYPGKSLVNWEVIFTEPGSFGIILEKCNRDSVFRRKVNEKIANDLVFAKKFKEALKTYTIVEKSKVRQ